MLNKDKLQQLRFQGFCNTPNLWKNNTVFDFKQLELKLLDSVFNKNIIKNLRLGELVEQFVLHELKQDNSVSVLSENIQIQNEKITVGELDCLLLQNQQPIHLEIVYKFYLYDPEAGTDLECWVGPNRNDTLLKKLDKLKDKQFPLLYNALTESHLESIGYKSSDFQQNVCFKAQLFLPYSISEIDTSPLNQECIKGYYIKQNVISEFKDCKFFIPDKLDWLLDIPVNIDWFKYDTFNLKINELLNNRTSPLCWIKKPNGETLKCFVIWW